MLEIRNLNVNIGDKPILNDISLRVSSGELCCVIGPNGSGKSTLLRSISGSLTPSSGQLLWQDKPLPTKTHERAKIVAMLPQNLNSSEEMRVEEMAMLGRTPHLPAYGMPSKADHQSVEEALDLVAPDLKNRLLSTLSGGERQRAMLARPLATLAPILLLDEPISALDVRYQHEILALVLRLTRQRKLATVCVLHGINLASLIADSMLLLEAGGKQVAFGTPSEVLTESNLSQVYEMPLKIISHPVSGRPQAQSMWDFNITP
jgi:ABC-type cobalamin/Fe3+-siderophores transport system ATPase subunit